MIEEAVIPAAGYGLRMEPLTQAIPKEMLPLGHLPLIEHTIIELVSSNIKKICIVIRKGKEMIKEYFERRHPLYKKVEFYFAYQQLPLGLGDAIRKAKDFIEGAPFLMAIPDQLFLSKVPATQQLLDACKEKEGIWNSMVKIPKKEISFFKGSRPFKYRKKNRGYYVIEDISMDETSLIRGFGRTVFLPEALEYMTEEYRNDRTGEVDFLKTFRALKNKLPLYGMILNGRPCDVGTLEGYYYFQPIIHKYLHTKGKSLW